MGYTFGWPATWILFHTLVRAQYGSDWVDIDPQAASHKYEFFDFVTRPDIIAPKWDVKVYNDNAVSPGYWFVSPYELIINYQPRSWVGPHIYEGNGDLIWSGSPLFNGFILNDFRVSSVNGKDMLTGVFAEEEEVLMINDQYEIHKGIYVGDEYSRTNRHDFHTLESGTRALAMTWQPGEELPDELRFPGDDGPCELRHGGFREYDTTTSQVLFDWSSRDHINLNESYKEPTCETRSYDYVHVNSIDKFPDGDYLLSGRMTDALYKISAIDGSIVWRLGGKISDFHITGHFSGQHSARVLSQNTTHIILTMFDNAIRPGEPHITNDQSRGMVLALHTDVQPMTAEVLRTYNHPQGRHTPGRGNFEILETGNTFSGWWNNSMLSENSPDGELVMEAQLRSELRSYRCYKFPWHGYPQRAPDVYAVSFASDTTRKGYSDLITVVFVSWNGATEVDQWQLYKSSASGDSRHWITTVPRHGFETMMTYRGYASYVVVEALDRAGNSLRRSSVVATVPSTALNNTRWIIDALHELEPATVWRPATLYIFAITTAIVVILAVCGLWYSRARIGSIPLRWTSRHRDHHRYEVVASVDEVDDVEKDQVYPTSEGTHAVELREMSSRFDPP